MGEFVHYFAESFADAPAPSIIVADIEDGVLMRIATVREWEWGAGGHLPTVRERLRARREARRAARAAPPSVAFPGSAVIAFPRATYGGPMMMGGYGGSMRMGGGGGFFRGGSGRRGGGC